jgi:primary-amine oxidase
VDFSFYVSLTRDNGLRLYDIRYKGKRIMYEVSFLHLKPYATLTDSFQLGLDEAIAHYA